MIGHGWQLIEAAPRGEATPTLFAVADTDAPWRTVQSAEYGESVGQPPARRGTVTAPGRAVERVRAAFRAMAARAGGAQSGAAGQPPPRWPARDAR
jgi:hypothetical protein